MQGYIKHTDDIVTEICLVTSFRTNKGERLRHVIEY